MRSACKIVPFAFMLGNCTPAPSPAPTPDMSKMTKCQQVAYILTNQYSDDTSKAVAIEIGRNQGCFGTPQPQQVRIEHTIRAN